MALVSVRDVSVAFGSALLLDRVELHVEPGERVCLLGRNGTGKSTLLRIISGALEPDSGSVDRSQGLRIGVLPQQLPADLSGSVFDVAAGGRGRQLSDERRRVVETVLSRLSLDGEAEMAPLSAGTKRRVVLARALALDPELLLLDEPTNHLDVATIRWLEDLLARHRGTLIVVTHDRAFMQRLATRIAELDRGVLYDFPGDYDTYLRRKEQALKDEHVRNAQLDKKLAKEETWLQRGLKARRARNEGRVRALMGLREQRAARRERVGSVRMNVQQADRPGKLAIEAAELSVRFGELTVVDRLSTIILRGDKVGVLGPNNCGKTTLLRALLGELPPSAGRVRRGARLQVAYFDQLREQLDDGRTVEDNVGEGRDTVHIDGHPRHVITYLKDFLFTAERARTPVAALSGGERNRLLLARLFLRPSNLLVLDEPTNDLDVETLELLEQRLIEYAGTVIVVSHDRAFLDNVVTSTLVFEGDGRFVDYAGGYSDWLRQRAAIDRETEAAEAKPKGVKDKTVARGKLSYKQQRELEQLPARIEALEAEQAKLHAAMSSPDLHERGGEFIARSKARLPELETEIEHAYERWQALETIEPQ